MTRWKRISAPEDFTSAVVYHTAGQAGPIYRVEFPNEEPRIQRHQYIVVLMFAGFSAIWISPLIGIWPGEFSTIHVIALWGALISGIGGGIWLGRPWRTTRAIDLDLGEHHFRVRRNGEITYERTIEAFKNLSVDDHPELEAERNERREENKKGPGPLEKQHVLFGWFGPEAAEAVELLYRIEWPKRYSLQEIAGAVNWAMTKATHEPPSAAEPKAADDPTAARKGAGSMNPPLD